MPKVTVKNLHSKTIHCKAKTEKLLDILLNETDWMHACGKKGNCTTCTAIVLDGADNLSPLTASEERFANLGRLKSSHRLACQAVVRGDVTVAAPMAYKLPHIDYSE